MTPHVGGSFGKYGSLSVEPVCAALTMKSRQTGEDGVHAGGRLPVRTETRQTYSAVGKIGVRKDGTLTALQEKLIVDGGAYFSRNCTTTMANMGSFTGLYRCPNVAAEADCVYTNILPTGGIRGYGNSEAMCVLELLVDRAAKEIGMDPLELRLKNIKKAGDPDGKGQPMETCTLEELDPAGRGKDGLGREEETEEGRRPEEVRHRDGDHDGCERGPTASIQHRNAHIKFNEDGSASLIVTAYDMGQNLPGTCAQIAAEVLGIGYEDIHVVNGDTDGTMFDTGIGASAGLYQVGYAVMNAALAARRGFSNGPRGSGR